MIKEEGPVVTRIPIQRLEGMQLHNHAWSLEQTHWLVSSKRGR